ncbi:hypothetical protein D3C73_1212610 [compost metagenome]
MFFFADFQPVLEQNDSRFREGALHQRHRLQETLGLFLGAKTQHPFHAGAVVPATVKNHDLAGGGQEGKVPLHIHLGLLAIRGCGQRDDTEDARADARCDGLDRATFTGAIASFKNNAHLGARVNDPLLKLDEFDVQPRQFFFVSFTR